MILQKWSKENLRHNEIHKMNAPKKNIHGSKGHTF